MAAAPMDNFREIDRQTGFLLPPSIDEWLPEEHLARFVVEIVDGLDLRSMSGRYRGSGSKSYHPRLLLSVVFYGYATGVFSSRKLERATYDSVASARIFGHDECQRALAACRTGFKDLDPLRVFAGSGALQAPVGSRRAWRGPRLAPAMSAST